MASNIRINRLFISEVPDLYNFSSIAGEYAYDIFSAYQIINHIADRADELKIDLDAQDRKDLPKLLSAALSDDDDKVRRTAEDVADDFGRRLGLIIHTLVTAPANIKTANSRYTAEDWEPWEKCKTVCLTGGLSNGLLGKRLIQSAENLLSELGANTPRLILAENPSASQLIGCARLNNDSCAGSVVFDFGQSFVKSGIASYRENDLTDLRILPKVPTQYMANFYPDDEAKSAEKLHGFIVDTISDAYIKHSDKSTSSHIAVSIAANLRNGSIYGGGGSYCKLKHLCDSYEKYLSDCVSEKLGRKIRISLIHDGYAAALCYAGHKNTVLIALGTAFGVGWPEDIPNLKNIDTVSITE